MGYVITWQRGEALLVQPSLTQQQPSDPARMYAPHANPPWSPVRVADSFLKFGGWVPYAGPQAALDGVLPEPLWSQAEG
jgi:hypothetical protein